MAIISVTDHATVPDKAIKDFRGAEGSGTPVTGSNPVSPVNPWAIAGYLDAGQNSESVIDQVEAPFALGVDPWSKAYGSAG